MNEIQLQKLTLFNFKNYEELSLDVNTQATCFLGLNGSGKTNLLDSIHYLCTCKSYFNPVDSQNIRFEADQFAITGDFLRMNQPEHIICSVRRNQRKIFKRNFKEYDRLAEHIGLLPCVIITPYDIELIWEGSEIRRKLLDSTIAQLSKTYLEDLIAYNHALLQRNARDRQLERTSSGAHRDDIDFLIGAHPLKKFASQGQQKSFLFALKFAQYLFISEAIGAKPILLLDDFFDKIDEQRVAKIIQWLASNGVGQIFITDTHHERAPRLLKEAGLTVSARKVEAGNLVAF